VLHCGPENVKGIEINQYAAELARTTIWIGDIQWKRRNGFEAKEEPVLRPLDAIECRDALLTKKEDGKYEEAQWPEAEFIVGNPPFLGGVKIRRNLGNKKYAILREIFSHVPATADYVTYWFEKAKSLIDIDHARLVGFIATNSIRGQASREILRKIHMDHTIFEAWSHEDWTIDGAAVDVSIVCFCAKDDPAARAGSLDGNVVLARILPDLTAGSFDLTIAGRLPENRHVAFQGSKKVGPFEIPGETARQWLVSAQNPNGRTNSDVLKPSWIAVDLVKSPRDVWIVDFGVSMQEADAALYELPFEYVARYVRPIREENNRSSRKKYWWRHGDAQPAMRTAIGGLLRCIVTPEVSKHRIFRWLPPVVLPDCKLMVIARDDDVSFGILHSRFHEAWSLRRGMTLEDRPTYTPSSTFETFPFP
jgi:type II restriction/modification system DNA methylase subunit YeeA